MRAGSKHQLRAGWQRWELRIVLCLLAVMAGITFYFAPPPIMRVAEAASGSCLNPEHPCTGYCCGNNGGGPCCDHGCCNGTCCNGGCYSNCDGGEKCCPPGKFGCCGTCCDDACCDSDEDGQVDGCALCDWNFDGDKDGCYECDSDNDGKLDACGLCTAPGGTNKDRCWVCDSDEDWVADACYLCDLDGDGDLGSCLVCDANLNGIADTCATDDADDDGVNDSCFLHCDTDNSGNNDHLWLCDTDGDYINDDCWQCDSKTDTDTLNDKCFDCVKDGGDGVNDGCFWTFTEPSQLGQCSNTVQTNPPANNGGCGSDEIDVPDNPCFAQGTSFTQCCIDHDECYSDCTRTKDGCDEQFHDCMEQVCTDANNPNCGFPGNLVYANCDEAADDYYDGVQDHGQDPYNDSQMAHCACCE